MKGSVERLDDVRTAQPHPYIEISSLSFDGLRVHLPGSRLKERVPKGAS
jgi:hypothetical protein